jgi:hypothetical protein
VNGGSTPSSLEPSLVILISIAACERLRDRRPRRSQRLSEPDLSGGSLAAAPFLVGVTTTVCRSLSGGSPRTSGTALALRSVKIKAQRWEADGCGSCWVDGWCESIFDASHLYRFLRETRGVGREDPNPDGTKRLRRTGELADESRPRRFGSLIRVADHAIAAANLS